MTKEEIFTKWKNEVNDLGDAYNLLNYVVDEHEAELRAKDEHIDLCRKTNTDLAAKCWGYVERLKEKEKEIAFLNDTIIKQHVTTPIKMLVCERCGKELGGVE